MDGDIVERANRWLDREVSTITQGEADAAELLDEAVTEIEELRRIVDKLRLRLG